MTRVLCDRCGHVLQEGSHQWRFVCGDTGAVVTLTIAAGRPGFLGPEGRTPALDDLHQALVAQVRRLDPVCYNGPRD